MLIEEEARRRSIADARAYVVFCSSYYQLSAKRISAYPSQDSKRVDRRKAYIKALFEGTKMKNKPKESKKSKKESEHSDEEEDEYDEYGEEDPM